MNRISQVVNGTINHLTPVANGAMNRIGQAANGAKSRFTLVANRVGQAVDGVMNRFTLAANGAANRVGQAVNEAKNRFTLVRKGIGRSMDATTSYFSSVIPITSKKNNNRLLIALCAVVSALGIWCLCKQAEWLFSFMNKEDVKNFTLPPSGPTSGSSNGEGDPSTRSEPPSGPTSTRSEPPSGPTSTRSAPPSGPTSTRSEPPSGPTSTRSGPPSGPTSTRSDPPSGPTSTSSIPPAPSGLEDGSLPSPESLIPEDVENLNPPESLAGKTHGGLTSKITLSPIGFLSEIIPLRIRSLFTGSGTKTAPITETEKTAPITETEKTAPITETEKTAPITETEKTAPITETEKTAPIPWAYQQARFYLEKVRELNNEIAKKTVPDSEKNELLYEAVKNHPAYFNKYVRDDLLDSSEGVNILYDTCSEIYKNLNYHTNNSPLHYWMLKTLGTIAKKGYFVNEISQLEHGKSFMYLEKVRGINKELSREDIPDSERRELLNLEKEILDHFSMNDRPDLLAGDSKGAQLLYDICLELYKNLSGKYEDQIVTLLSKIVKKGYLINEIYKPEREKSLTYLEKLKKINSIQEKLISIRSRRNSISTTDWLGEAGTDLILYFFNDRPNLLLVNSEGAKILFDICLELFQFLKIFNEFYAYGSAKLFRTLAAIAERGYFVDEIFEIAASHKKETLNFELSYEYHIIFREISKENPSRLLNFIKESIDSNNSRERQITLQAINACINANIETETVLKHLDHLINKDKLSSFETKIIFRILKKYLSKNSGVENIILYIEKVLGKTPEPDKSTLALHLLKELNAWSTNNDHRDAIKFKDRIKNLNSLLINLNIEQSYLVPLNDEIDDLKELFKESCILRNLGIYTPSTLSLNRKFDLALNTLPLLAPPPSH